MVFAAQGFCCDAQKLVEASRGCGAKPCNAFFAEAMKLSPAVRLRAYAVLDAQQPEIV